MKAEDKKFNKDVQELAENLTLHIAAMKPNYLNKREVPSEVKARYDGDTDLWKMYKAEVLME
jgi:translation elongation factor EF-Ts